jgi:hypothetical protein
MRRDKLGRVRRRQGLLCAEVARRGVHRRRSRVEVARRQDSSSGCRTTTTGHGAERRTRSVTLPIMSRSKPERPCVPMTIRPGDVV